MQIIRRFTTPTANPNLGGRNYWKGWCHAHVRSGFGIPAKAGYGSATEAWQKAKRRHAGRNFPAADVPLFFSVRGVPAGHVVAHLASGTIVTSGLNDTQKSFSSLDALLAAWPALTYLGWTEDLNGSDIITGYVAAAPSKSIAQMAAEVIAGQHGTGHENRRRSLGVSAAVYEQVRAEVNRLVASKRARTYTVVRGDNLIGIAKRYGTTYQVLAKLNGLPNPNKIRTGQVLRLP